MKRALERTVVRGFALTLSTLLLTSCGGGGGSSSSSDNSVPLISAVTITDINGGHALEGDTLRADYSYADDEDTANVAGEITTEAAMQINWLRNGAIIEAAVGNEYVLQAEDIDHVIAARLTVIAPQGSATGPSYTSNEVATGIRTGELLPIENFYSAITDWTYTIDVYLPGGYSDTNNHYPVMYQVDRLSDRAEILDAEAKKVILVTIASDVDRRQIDYTLPGAHRFLDVLTMELIPYIESQYRVDSGQRTLMGHSLGGSFAAAALLIDQRESPYFIAYITSDGGFGEQAWRYVELERKLALLTDRLPISFIITSALIGGNSIGSEGLYNMFLERGYAELQLNYFPFEARHDETFELSFRLALDMLYP